MYSVFSYTSKANIQKSADTCSLLKPDTNPQKISLVLEITGVALCAILGSLVLTHGWGIHSISQIGTIGSTGGILILAVPAGTVGIDVFVGSIIKALKTPKNIEVKPDKKGTPVTEDTSFINPNKTAPNDPKTQPSPSLSSALEPLIASEDIQENQLLKANQLRESLAEKKQSVAEMAELIETKTKTLAQLKDNLTKIDEEKRSTLQQIKSTEEMLALLKTKIKEHKDNLARVPKTAEESVRTDSQKSKEQQIAEYKQAFESRLKKFIAITEERINEEEKAVADLQKNLDAINKNQQQELELFNQKNQEIQQLQQEEYHGKLEIAELEGAIAKLSSIS